MPTSRTPLESFPVTGFGPVTPDWAWAGADGSGVRVCVMDSGIQGDHPVVGEPEMSMIAVNDPDGQVIIVPGPAEDPNGHGTACATIIKTMAPGCSISSVRVLTGGQAGSGAALLAGLAWAIDEGFDVVNLSLATTRERFRAPLQELADRAYFRRTSLIVSANNAAVHGFPWRFASVISVASHDEADSFRHYYNPCPPVEFYARGIAVPVTTADGSVSRVTGNSFAAPHVAGLAALIVSKHQWLTPFQLKSVLFLTAHNTNANLGA